MHMQRGNYSWRVSLLALVQQAVRLILFFTLGMRKEGICWKGDRYRVCAN